MEEQGRRPEKGRLVVVPTNDVDEAGTTSSDDGVQTLDVWLSAVMHALQFEPVSVLAALLNDGVDHLDTEMSEGVLDAMPFEQPHAADYVVLDAAVLLRTSNALPRDRFRAAVKAVGNHKMIGANVLAMLERDFAHMCSVNPPPLPAP